MKSEKKKKKESRALLLNKESEGRRLVQAVHVQQASQTEAGQIERALDRLLHQMVEQARAQRRER